MFLSVIQGDSNNVRCLLGRRNMVFTCLKAKVTALASQLLHAFHQRPGAAAGLGRHRKDAGFRAGPGRDLRLKQGDVPGHDALFAFVDFVENQSEGEPTLDQPLHELQVDLLRWDAGVDDDKNTRQPLATGDVVGDDIVEVVALFLEHLRIAIAWQIDKPPFFVDDEKIDQLGMSRCRGHLGKIFFPGKHVQQR